MNHKVVFSSMHFPSAQSTKFSVQKWLHWDGGWLAGLVANRLYEGFGPRAWGSCGASLGSTGLKDSDPSRLNMIPMPSIIPRSTAPTTALPTMCLGPPEKGADNKLTQ